MRSELITKLALGLVGICAVGSAAGMSLANYTTSGSFEFYKQQRVAEWQPEPTGRATALESSDLAFAADRRGDAGSAAPEEVLASLTP